MKLLFDQNISFRVIRGIKSVFPLAKQVRELGLENSTDLEIWNFAQKEGYTIVTFDSDFYDLSLIKGFPPKILWLVRAVQPRVFSPKALRVAILQGSSAATIKSMSGSWHSDILVDSAAQ